MLTALGSETCDTNLGIVYSKTGLDDATAERFAKQNYIKQQNYGNKIKFTTKIKHKGLINPQNTKLRPFPEILKSRVSNALKQK